MAVIFFVVFPFIALFLTLCGHFLCLMQWQRRQRPLLSCLCRSVWSVCFPYWISSTQKQLPVLSGGWSGAWVLSLKWVSLWLFACIPWACDWLQSPCYHAFACSIPILADILRIFVPCEDVSILTHPRVPSIPSTQSIQKTRLPAHYSLLHSLILQRYTSAFSPSDDKPLLMMESPHRPCFSPLTGAHYWPIWVKALNVWRF